MKTLQKFSRTYQQIRFWKLVERMLDLNTPKRLHEKDKARSCLASVYLIQPRTAATFEGICASSLHGSEENGDIL